MIELIDNGLNLQFPDVHSKARCKIDFQRTLRIPDDNRDYPLPPGLGRFPVQHVDDYASKLPEAWRSHGGVFLPMYQSEALWINFSGHYPCAIKIAAGKIDAVSGKMWSNRLSRNPQDYVVIPDQPWLDGFNVAEGYIRQFVAMPLGEGFTVEEQITGEAEHGGLQIVAYPMKRKVYERHFELPELIEVSHHSECESPAFPEIENLDMGLAPGGLMRQKIYKDQYGINAWDQDNAVRCFVHLANSAVYESITGCQPPYAPPKAKQYADAGLPWFEYYSDQKALGGVSSLAGVTSVGAKTIEKGNGPMEGNDAITPTVIKPLGSSNVVRDGDF